MAMSYSRFYEFLSHRWWLAFLLMGMCFVIFGVVTLNLLHTLAANFEFLSMYGIDAIRDGGLLQLLDAAVSGYFGAASYVVFKLCEKVLVERLAVSKNKGAES